MQIDFWHVLTPFLIAFLVTLFTTPLAIIILTRLKILDDPTRQNHPGLIHKMPIPRGGGIPLFLGVFVSALLFLPWTNIVISIFFAAFLVLCIGIIDDKLNAKAKDVSPYLRLLIIILCAVIVVGSGISIDFTTNPFSATPSILHFDQMHIPLLFGLTVSVAQLLSILWIIWVMTMLNWSKGIDGQMPGIVIISSIVIGLLSLKQAIDPSALVDAKLSFIIAGATLGFLIFNFSPAKIFPGYGASAIYLLLAVVSILSSAKLATALLVMGVPAVDALFTIGRRLLAKKNPFFGDNQHLHHLFLKLGYTQRQIALFYWAISAILGLASLTLQSRSKVFAIIMLITIVGMVLFFLHFVLRNTNEESTS